MKALLKKHGLKMAIIMIAAAVALFLFPVLAGYRAPQVVYDDIDNGYHEITYAGSAGAAAAGQPTDASGNDKNRSGLGDGTNPGQGSGTANSPNEGTDNPNNATGGGNDQNRSGLGDGTSPAQGSGTANSPNQGSDNPSATKGKK